MKKDKSGIDNKKKSVFEFLLSAAFLLIGIINLFLIRAYSRNAAIFLGCLILIVSIMLLVKNRHDKKYILLFGILLYVNFSILISDILTGGSIVLPENTLIWQRFRGTQYEMTLLNSLFIFVAIINFIDSFSRRYTKREIGESENEVSSEPELKNKNSLLIYIICCGVVIAGLITGYRNSSIEGSYLSATSTLYEYCIIFLAFAWYYAGNKKERHIFIIILAILYIIQAMIYGDRSSTFPMIMLLVILYCKRLSIPKIVLAAVVGILVANAVATYRESYTLSDFSQKYSERYNTMSLASDTVSQAYYTGVSTLYVRDVVKNPPHYFKDYLIGLVAGGGYGGANVTALAKKYATNKGGGMVVSDFYFWFGYYGVILEAIIVGAIIARLRNGKSAFSSLWKICITVMAFRWYLYGSFVFFRSCIVVFLTVYVFLWMIYNFRNKNKKRFLPLENNKGEGH